jgi:hypothetical protein
MFTDARSTNVREGSVIELEKEREDLAQDDDGKKVEAKESGKAADATADDDAAAAAAPTTKIDVGMDVMADSMAVSKSWQSG